MSQQFNIPVEYINGLFRTGELRRGKPSKLGIKKQFTGQWIIANSKSLSYNYSIPFYVNDKADQLNRHIFQELLYA